MHIKLGTRMCSCICESLGLHGARPEASLRRVSQPSVPQPSLTQLGKVSWTGKDQGQQPSPCHR